VAGNVLAACTKNGATALNGVLRACQQRSMLVENKSCNYNIINNLHPPFKPIYTAFAARPKRLRPKPSANILPASSGHGNRRAGHFLPPAEQQFRNGTKAGLH